MTGLVFAGTELPLLVESRRKPAMPHDLATEVSDTAAMERCWFCGRRTPDAFARFEAKMHMAFPDKVQKSIPVPRCAKCARFHRFMPDLGSTSAMALPLMLLLGFFAMVSNRSLGTTALISFGGAVAFIAVAEKIFPSRIRPVAFAKEFPIVQEHVARGWALGDLPKNPKPVSIGDWFGQQKEGLTHPQSVVRLEVVENLRRVGRALYGQSRGASASLERVYAESITQVLIGTIEDPDAAVRLATLRALATFPRWGVDVGVESLLPSLHAPEAMLRRAALDVFLGVADHLSAGRVHTALPYFANLLRDENREVRLCAAGVLETLHRGAPWGSEWNHDLTVLIAINSPRSSFEDQPAEEFVLALHELLVGKKQKMMAVQLVRKQTGFDLGDSRSIVEWLHAERNDRKRIESFVQTVRNSAVSCACLDEEVLATLHGKYSPEAAALKLAAIYARHPDGFITASVPKEVLHLGSVLNDAGGMDRMLEAHRLFQSQCPILGAPRNLEHMWDGIGSWAG